MPAQPDLPYPRSVVPLRTALRAVPAPVQQPLPLAWTLPGGVPAAPLTIRPATRSVEPPPDRLPDPAAWVASLVVSTVEVLNGDRPLAQLLRWVDHTVYQQLAAARSGRSGVLRPAVRSVHLCRPRDGIAEAAVLVGSGSGWRAVTVRLEAAEHRWRCTHLRFL